MKRDYIIPSFEIRTMDVKDHLTTSDGSEDGEKIDEKKKEDIARSLWGFGFCDDVSSFIVSESH